MRPLYEEALALQALGKSIFPLLPRDKKPDADLLPKDENGKATWTPFQTTRASAEQITAWWTASPDSNIAMATGAVSGGFVVDVDGADGIAELNKHGKMPRTPVAKTSSGYHVHFKHPGGTIPNRVKFLPGLDTRGDGGYVVAPPSIHPSGAVYRWIVPFGEAPLADCPTWLLEEIRPKREERPAPRRDFDQSDNDQYELAQAAINALDPGRRENYEQWIAVGMSLRQLGAAGLSLWENWSAGSTKFKARDCVGRFEKFAGRKGLGSLFYMADRDAGTAWRPVRRWEPQIVGRPDVKLPDGVEKAIDRTWDEGMPNAVRAAFNLYAPTPVGPMMELYFEGVTKKLIPENTAVTFECLKCVSQALHRGVSDHTIRSGLKLGAGQFLRKWEHIKDLGSTIPPNAEEDICAENRRNCAPCRNPGRYPDAFDVLPRKEIINALARLSVAPIVLNAFPPESGIVAPILTEFLETLGRDNAEQLSADLNARYKDTIDAQPGYAQAISRARREYEMLVKSLMDPTSAPIPEGRTYTNHAEYLSACARAVIDAEGGETQYSRVVWCRMIGCADKKLKTVFDGAGIVMDKHQYAEQRITDTDQLKAIKPKYDAERKGFPAFLVSSASEDRIKFGVTKMIPFAEKQLAENADLFLLYHQANRQVVRRLPWLLVEFVNLLLRLLAAWLKPAVLPDVEPEPEQREIWPESALETPELTIEERYARQVRIRALLPVLAHFIQQGKKVGRKESRVEMWIKNLASRVTDWRIEPDRALNQTTGEIAEPTIQLAFDALLEVEEKPVLRVVNFGDVREHWDPQTQTWDSPDYVYIGRANFAYRLPESPWANPYKIGDGLTRKDVIDLYGVDVMSDPVRLAAVRELRGKTPVCWCAPEACHGDVLVELMDLPDSQLQTLINQQLRARVEADPVLSWVESQLGGTVTAVEKTELPPVFSKAA